MNKRRKLYFDGTPLVNKYVSGVGQVLLQTLTALDTDYYSKKYRLNLFVPFDEVSKLKKYTFKHVRIKSLPYPHKFLSLFSRLLIAPPLDLFLGKGIYIFENFRNWPLIFSKSITYVHDVSFKVYPEFVEKDNLRYLEKYVPVWTKRTNKIVTVSDAAKSEIEEYLGIQGVSVVKNAVNTGLFYPRTQDEVQAQCIKWGLPKNYFVVLGNIEPRKNIQNVVKAFAIHAEKHSDDALIIIGGDGWKNEGVMSLIENESQKGVHIIRPKTYVPDEDLPALLTGAQGLLQLSWHEGFGLPLLQALACGTPVVASDIPVLHEAAGENSNQVIFTSPNDTDQIAQAIQTVKSLGHVTEPRYIADWSQSIVALEKIIDTL